MLMIVKGLDYWGEFPPPWWDAPPPWLRTIACWSVDTTGRLRGWWPL